VTESTSPSLVETGTELEMDSPAASPLPKMEMSEPGATTARLRLHSLRRWVGWWCLSYDGGRHKGQATGRARSLNRIALSSQKSKRKERCYNILTTVYFLLTALTCQDKPARSRLAAKMAAPPIAARSSAYPRW